MAATGRSPAITLDCWIAQNNNTYIGSTGHYFTKDGDLRSVCLFLKELPPPHTANNIRSKTEDELEKYNISAFQIITDNAANMKAAINLQIFNQNEEDDLDDPYCFIVETDIIEIECDKNWQVCVAHTLQLVVRDSMKHCYDYPTLQRALAKCYKIAKLSHKSTNFNYHLQRTVPTATDFFRLSERQNFFRLSGGQKNSVN